MPKSKVLIATKSLDHDGGVVNYYRIFVEKFESDSIELVHMTFGSRMKYYYAPWIRIILYPIIYCVDYFRLMWCLLSDRNVRIVQISPSLIPVPLIRDAFVILGAKLFRRRLIVFFRGWKEHVVHALKRRAVLRSLFRLTYGCADTTLVLASRFKDDLVDLGWPASRVHITTTMYQSSETIPISDRAGRRPKFLFLGRISNLKGVGEIIEALALLAKRGIRLPN